MFHSRNNIRRTNQGIDDFIRGAMFVCHTSLYGWIGLPDLDHQHFGL